MKKLYCAVLLLLNISSVYGMQKKKQPSKKFNIHNDQNAKKNKNPKNKIKYNRWVEEKLDKKLDKIGLIERVMNHRNFEPSLTLAVFVVVWSSPIVAITYDPRLASINWSAVIEC